MDFVSNDYLLDNSQYEKYIRITIFLVDNRKAFLIVVLGFIVGLYYVLSPYMNKNVPDTVSECSSVEEAKGTIFVDVSGAVKSPGVYEINSSARLVEAIERAGSLNNDVSIKWLTQNMNLASTLFDGQKVYIPFESDLMDPKMQEVLITFNTAQSTNTTNKTSIVENVVEGSNKVNLNSASLEILVELPGIGNVYGQKIIENRPYKDIEDLVSKTGISTKTVEKFQNQIVF